MGRVRNVLLLALVALALQPLIAGGARQRPGEGPQRVTIGYQIIPNGAIVAKQLGWHEQAMGVPVRWVEFNSGAELNAAIAAGSVDIGLGGSSTTVAAIAAGVPAQVIWIYDIIGENEALVVRSASGVRSVTDLRGRRVAAPFGATTHYHLMVALELAGVAPEELTILDMPPSDLRAAWQRGDIDAGFVWEPTLAALIDLGGHVLLTSGELAAQGYLTGDIAIVRTGFAEAHPDLVERYLETQVRAIEYIRTRPDDAAEAIAREFGLEPSEALRQMNSLVFLSGSEQLSADYLGVPGQIGALADVFVATAEFLASQRTIRAAPSREEFEVAINPSYLARVVGERP